MSVTLGTLDTGSNLHGTIESGLWTADRSVQTWFGLTGAAVLLGALHTRELQCWLQLSGYASHDAVQDGIDTINSNINQSGTLTVTGATWTNTIFLGYETTEPPWNDASGVNGWLSFGTLRFQQVKT